MNIAIIGSGVSGSLVARLLSTQHQVTLFEANEYPGGHANTVDVAVGGTRYPVDTGFMVFNRRTYPNFCRLLEMLNIASQPSDMSFSVSCAATGLEYQGSSLNGLFAQRRNVLRPAFYRMLRDIFRFNRLGTTAAASGQLLDGRTVGQFLTECGVGSMFVQRYLVPMAAAIWSSKPQAILEFPANFLVGFFANHGLLQIADRPQWRTIRGGSRNYIRALLSPIRHRLRLNEPISAVRRESQQVIVTTQPVTSRGASDGQREQPGREESFDHVVFASHADQTLRMLSDATDDERRTLSAFPYQPNRAVLHTDTSVLPRRRRAWASWNYHIPEADQQSASVTYDLSRLQRHLSADPILLTLNDERPIDPERILRTFKYHHPAFSRESIAAQRCFDVISGKNRTHFCGAYWGYGFHEDGVNSALAVSSYFGIGLEACTAASTRELSGTAVTSR